MKELIITAKKEYEVYIKAALVSIDSNLISSKTLERKAPFGTFGLTGIEIAATITATSAVINLALNIYDRLKTNEHVKFTLKEKEGEKTILISKKKTKDEIANEIEPDEEKNS